MGGGGPQAAFGAAAALACRDHCFRGGVSSLRYDSSEFPPKQKVTFMGPIGLQNWNQQYTLALDRILLPMLDTPPVLISSNDHITPTIDIWHDADEVQKWRPVHGSFDITGADGLWRNRPSAADILAAIQNESGDIVLHSIVESGSSPPSKGEDSLFLDDAQLMSKVHTLGIEPVVFPDECTLKVSDKDGKSVSRLVAKANVSLTKEDQTNNKLLVITPDKPCFDSAFVKVGSYGNPSTEIIVRNGSNGSFLKQHHIPSATLKTSDNTPVNPTGAGNAYSAAYVACRGTGSSPEEAACLASAVGAVVCEYEHLPEWSWSVLERIAEAAKEVESKLTNPSIVESKTML